jgi:hypothetical protein
MEKWVLDFPHPLLNWNLQYFKILELSRPHQGKWQITSQQLWTRECGKKHHTSEEKSSPWGPEGTCSERERVVCGVYVCVCRHERPGHRLRLWFNARCTAGGSCFGITAEILAPHTECIYHPAWRCNKHTELSTLGPITQRRRRPRASSLALPQRKSKNEVRTTNCVSHLSLESHNIYIRSGHNGKINTV